MPKLTAQERADLEARLAADDEEDEDDECEYGFPDGGYVKGKFRRVADIAETRGHKLRKPKPPAKLGDDKDDDKTDGKRFQAGRRI